MKTDTHHYDGSLHKEESIFLREHITKVHCLGVDEKFSTIQHSFETIVNFPFTGAEKTPQSVQLFQNVVQSYGNDANFDSTNGISADDLLYIIALEWENICMHKNDLQKDFLSELFIQLTDLQSGMCPQGRVMRLWQIASAYLEMYNFTPQVV